MSNQFSRASYLKRQNVVIRYTAGLVLLLATLYVVTMASASSDESADKSDNNSVSITEKMTAEAPKEALLKSQEYIHGNVGGSVSTEVQASQNTASYEAEIPSVETNVSVNGQQIKVDDNSRVRKVIKSEDQKTMVDISTKSSTTSNNHSSLNISIRSTSSTKGDDY